MRKTFVLLTAGVLAALFPAVGEPACCYFAAKDKDIAQPGQKAFLTYDPVEKVETFTVQPKFEGNAADFGMVIPTPSRPKLDEMPRDFFKALAVFTILKRRVFPESSLLPRPPGPFGEGMGLAGAMLDGSDLQRPRPKSVRELEAGVVGNLDYKIIAAERADDLFQWLKANNYRYAGDEATLDFYVRKGWVFTVMKIDTMQLKREANGQFVGEITPTRFQFTTEKFVYPLRITQISVKDKTEALFYVQAPFKADLAGDLTFQFRWAPLYLLNAKNRNPSWIEEHRQVVNPLIQRSKDLGFRYVIGKNAPNAQGITLSALEWAKKLTAEEIKVLNGQAPYSETVPEPDEGFKASDVRDPNRADEVYKVINERLEKYRKERPNGYLVREAPAEEVKQLKLLVGHLKEGQFLTKFRKTFTRAEMAEDLEIVPAKWGDKPDVSEYEEVLRGTPP